MTKKIENDTDDKKKETKKKPKKAPKKTTPAPSKDMKLTFIAEKFVAESFNKYRNEYFVKKGVKPAFGGIRALRDNGDFVLYNKKEGIWEFDRQTELEVEIAKHKDSINPTDMKHVLKKIKRYVYIKRDEFNTYKNLIAVRNCVINLDNWETRPFHHKFMLTKKIPVFFDDDATCPNFDAFLKSVVSDKDAKILWEFIGYCFYGEYHIRRALFIYGKTTNGKSLFLYVLYKLLGSKNYSTSSLAQLTSTNSSSDYYTAKLFNKMANINSDVSDENIRQTGTFKGLIGGSDKISARVIRESPIEFFNTAKLIFSGNELPSPDNDAGVAFMKRMITIEFPNTFEDDGKKGKELLDGMTTNAELSGILKKALSYLNRLLKRGYFDLTDRHKKYSMLSDPVQSFIDTQCELNDNYYTAKQDFYASYVLYCEKNRLKIEANNILGRIMKEKNFGSGKKKYGNYADRTWCYLGVSSPDMFFNDEPLIDEDLEVNL
ncbi:MAG: hypothetical protein HeimC2_40160 [Candidatus Heimdallarchaeota archaeon LC_2]|nr:MAG: hypothetical protein HeimC2_40160 [Candidatus Heimdallarchaeota archaeon LC_2]